MRTKFLLGTSTAFLLWLGGCYVWLWWHINHRIKKIVWYNARPHQE